MTDEPVPESPPPKKKSGPPKGTIGEEVPGPDGPYSYQPRPESSAKAKSGDRKCKDLAEVRISGQFAKQRSPRLRRFLELVASGKSLTEAKRIAGWAPSTKAKHILERARKVGFNDLMDKAGLTDEYLTEKLAEGAKAMKKVPIGNGEVIDDIDWTNRHRFLDTTLTVKGHLVRGGISPGGVQINNVFMGIQPDGVKGMLAGAFALMAKSAGVDIDQGALQAEIDNMSAKMMGAVGVGERAEDLELMEVVEAEITEIEEEGLELEPEPTEEPVLEKTD